MSKINFQRNSLKTYKFLSRLKNQTSQTAKRPFSINQKIITSHAKVAGYFLKYFTEANRKGAYARKTTLKSQKLMGCRWDDLGRPSTPRIKHLFYQTPRYLTLCILENPSRRCLKTPAGFLQEELKLKDSYKLNSELENLPTPRSPLGCRIFNVVTDPVPAVRKLDSNCDVLRSISYATINEPYPDPKWLRIYTDVFRVEQ
ncbi:hypothetical protein CDAR_465701 [Caerostris darwini]|uniref:Uncharacterized protein n=1 Tax=Caerostris darwini TaxID=1538125 RepID=A0AAV4V1J5_9ARAC|nr:hypothetical protein CDAR_465701 [Caerostris darwini]